MTRVARWAQSITLAAAMPPRASIGIRMEIERDGTRIYEGETSVARMARRFEDLIDWLGRENRFPGGVVLLTGTGIVPPDDFSLRCRRYGADHDRRDRHARQSGHPGRRWPETARDRFPKKSRILTKRRMRPGQLEVDFTPSGAALPTSW